MKVPRSHLSAHSIILSLKDLFLLHSQQLFLHRSLHKAFFISVISMEFNQLPEVLLIFTLSFPVKVSSRRHRVQTDTRYQCRNSNFSQYPQVTFQLRGSTTITLLTYFWHTFAYTAIPLLFHPTMLNFGGF